MRIFHCNNDYMEYLKSCQFTNVIESLSSEHRINQETEHRMFTTFKVEACTSSCRKLHRVLYMYTRYYHHMYLQEIHAFTSTTLSIDRACKVLWTIYNHYLLSYSLFLFPNRRLV